VVPPRHAIPGVIRGLKSPFGSPDILVTHIPSITTLNSFLNNHRFSGTSTGIDILRQTIGLCRRVTSSDKKSR
jgi:hypothetical protein